MTHSDAQLRLAHNHCYQNRQEIESSELCGCFYCLEQYSPDEVFEWVYPEGTTACCPNCGCDSVVGSESGFVISDGFLLEMSIRFFNRNLSDVVAWRQQRDTRNKHIEEELRTAGITRDYFSRCYWCEHYRGEAKCSAFGDEDIPRAIFLNYDKHEEPYEGDRGIRFRPREGIKLPPWVEQDNS